MYLEFLTDLWLTCKCILLWLSASLLLSGTVAWFNHIIYMIIQVCAFSQAPMSGHPQEAQRVSTWSWPLTGKIPVRGGFKRGFVKVSVSRAVHLRECLHFDYYPSVYLLITCNAILNCPLNSFFLPMYIYLFNRETFWKKAYLYFSSHCLPTLSCCFPKHCTYNCTFFVQYWVMGYL